MCDHSSPRTRRQVKCEVPAVDAVGQACHRCARIGVACDLAPSNSPSLRVPSMPSGLAPAPAAEGSGKRGRKRRTSASAREGGGSDDGGGGSDGDGGGDGQEEGAPNMDFLLQAMIQEATPKGLPVGLLRDWLLFATHERDIGFLNRTLHLAAACSYSLTDIAEGCPDAKHVIGIIAGACAAGALDASLAQSPVLQLRSAAVVAASASAAAAATSAAEAAAAADRWSGQGSPPTSPLSPLGHDMLSSSTSSSSSSASYLASSSSSSSSSSSGDASSGFPRPAVPSPPAVLELKDLPYTALPPPLRWLKDDDAATNDPDSCIMLERKV